MSLFSSLANRIFVAMAALTVLSIAASTYYVVSAVTAQMRKPRLSGVTVRPASAAP